MLRLQLRARPDNFEDVVALVRARYGDLPRTEWRWQDSQDAAMLYLNDLVEIGFTLGWPLFAPPEVPEQRIAALREAFARLVQDPGFAAAAQDVLRMEVDPIPGAELAGHVDQALSTPAPLVNEAIRLLGL